MPRNTIPDGGYTPAELLEICRKVWPESYGHIVWLLRVCLRLRADMPKEKHKGCSGELDAQTADKLIMKGEKQHPVK